MTENVHGLLAAYVVDAVDAVERAEFEAHLPGCEECSIELAELREVTSAMAAAEDGAAPAGLKARVMEEVARTPQAIPTPAQGDDATATKPAEPTRASSTRRRWLAPAWVAASVALLAGGFVVGDMLADRSARLGLESEVMMVASAPDAQAMDLGLGSAHLVMSERMHSVAAMGEDCPQPKDGMEYQLWLVMEDGTKMAGPTFMPDEDGSFMTTMDMSMDDVAAIAVTEEPRGGSEQPTTDAVAAVEL